MAKRKPKLRHVLPGLLSVYRHFWRDIRSQRGLICASVLALLCGVVFRLLEPWPLKIVLDRVIPTERPEGLAREGWLNDLSPTALILTAAGGIVVIASLRALADYVSRVGFFVIGNRVVIRLRDRVYRHLQALPLAFHDAARSGDLIIRVTRDVSLLRDVTATAVWPLIGSVMILVGMVGVMCWLQWRLALLSLAAVPLFWLATVRIGRRIRETAHKQRQREGAMASVAAESIAAIRVVQALSLQDKFAEDFSNRNQASQKEDLKASRLSARLGRLVDVLLALATAGVMGYGANLVLRGTMTPGDLVVFLAYLKRAFKPAQEFAKYTARMAKATAAGERVIDVLERNVEVADAPDAVVIEHLRGDICFRDVTFAYDSEVPVLQHLNLSVPAGRTVAIVGPSGAGKSTLVSLVLRLYDPAAGSICIDGREVRGYTLKSLRAHISVVLQETLLFAATIRDNIAYGAEDVSDAEIAQAAELAHAGEFIRQLPQGFDTVVGERGVTLSHGQRQRIALARAAVRNCPLLLLDEPTTGLDERTEKAVVEALCRLARTRTTLMVTHNTALACRADDIVYVDKGRILEQGSPRDLITAGGLFADLFQLRSAAQDAASKEVSRVLV